MTVSIAAPSRVHFEHLGPNVLGIGTPRPRLSWQAPSAPGVEVVGFDIRLEARGAVATYRRMDAETALQAWPGNPLSSRDRVVVAVRAVLASGDLSAWSEPSFVEAGLLDRSDWRGRFVGTGMVDSDSPAPILFRRIALAGPVASVRMYATARGMYAIGVNGHAADDSLLEPGWQDYSHRVRYRTYDLTDHARGTHELTIAAWLSDGWYRGELGFPLIAQKNVYGDRLAFLSQIEIVYVDGRTETVSTDSSWAWQPGPIQSAGLYAGEVFDARVPAQFDPSRARPVVDAGTPDIDLVAPVGPPVRAVQELSPTRIWKSPSGATLVDFGQNLVGWVRVRVSGESGSTIVLRHAEVLEDGELGTRPLRLAAATDSFTLAGDGVEQWEARFTYHGFRYIEVSGWNGDPEPEDLTAVVVHTDMRRTGWFSSSHPLLNRLHENVVWGMKGNFVDIPTDCPQRDERLGWTGDIAVFAPTASYLFDCAGMLSSWLEDLRAEQHSDGTVPFFVPSLPVPDSVAHVPGMRVVPAAVWGDAAVLVPVALFRATGDREILRHQYDSMVSWVDAVHALSGDSHIWDQGFQFGDWLDPSAPADDPAAGATDPALVATAYHARTAQLLADVAGELGRDEDRDRFGEMAASVRRAFVDRFIDSHSGAVRNDSQTALALVICFDLAPEELRSAIGERLVELVREADHLVSTGFVGTPLILDALTLVGAVEDAYAMVLQESLPSWGYTVAMGATTIWERWDSMLPDGSINPGEMTSFNHYAFGAVADWMHRVVGGLELVEPGWTRVRVAPRPRGGITSASTSHAAPGGLITVEWTIEDGILSVRASVPSGCRALIDLEGADVYEVGEGIHELQAPVAVDTVAAGA